MRARLDDYPALAEPERPVYVYDLSELDRRCSELLSVPLESCSIRYATMANDHPDVLAAVQRRGIGAFVNSPRHLQLALEAGFAPQDIVYAATNMAPAEMRDCLELGVRVVVDSITQLACLASIARAPVEVTLRVDVGSALDGTAIREDPFYRFGLLPRELPRALALARSSRVAITGVHAYFGTDVMEPRILVDGLDRLCAAAARLPDVRVVDVAGGFGVGASGEEFDLAAYARGAAELIARYEQMLGRELELVIEPGRYLVATCGRFVVSVIDVKERPDRTFVGTNGCVSIFPRPLLYPESASHPCAIEGATGAEPHHSKPVWICGNSTYSRDFLARAVTMPLPNPGDRLVFGNAGAYGRSMISEFLGKDRPDELVLPAVASPPMTAVA